MPLDADFVFTAGDTQPPITAQLTDAAGAGVPLDNVAVTFRMRPIDGGTLKVNANATLVTPAQGQVKYDWAPSGADTDTPGYYLGRFRAVYTNGAVMSFPNSGPLLILIVAAV